MSSIDEVLEKRGEAYGEFADHANITQSIKQAMQDSKNWPELDYDMVECLEMVAHKMGRILNGNPRHIDSWTDIIGYVRLVEKRLIAEARAEDEAEQEPCGCCNRVNIVQAMETLRKAGFIVDT